MFSKLCLSGYKNLKWVNKSPYVKFLPENCINSNCFILPKSYIHSYNEITETPDSLTDVVSDFSIPDLPTMDPNPFISTLSEPSFASLGLNNFTPPGLVQYILENVHTSLSLPWWACIGITAVLLRFCMLPLMLNQRRAMISYQNSMTTMTKTMVEAMMAKEAGNSLAMRDKMKEFTSKVSENELKILPLMIPILIQAPVSLSVFMALRGMAAVPVESLKLGGLSWFADLSVYDPYYILPLITSLSLALVLETGAEAPTPQSKNIKMAFRCLPVVSFFIVCHFPSTLLLYWTCSNLFSLAFVMLMKIPRFKVALNFQDVVPVDPMMEGRKYGMKEIQELMRSLQEMEMRTKAEQIRWKKEDQQDILKKGISAANERKLIKEALKVNVVDENNKTTANAKEKA